MNKIEKQIVTLNEIKKEMNSCFQISNFKIVLKDKGFTNINTLILGFKKFHIIESCEKSYIYKFTNPGKPIHISALENAFKHSKNCISTYTKKYRIKKDNPNIIKDSIEDQLEEAIKLLKKNGYQIYKPTISYEKI